MDYLTDAAGAPLAHYAYDAWGLPTEATSTATALIPAPLAAKIAEANVLRYAGYCYDEASGLYYLSQRYYDPQTCQFLTKDPAKADGEESAYQYCGGDPVGKVDPSGRWSIGATIVQSISWYVRQWESLKLVLAGVAVGILFPPASAAAAGGAVSGRALAKAIAGGITMRILSPFIEWVAHRDSNAIKKWGNPRLVYKAKFTRKSPYSALYLKVVAKVDGTALWRRYERVLFWRGYIWNGSRRYDARWS